MPLAFVSETTNNLALSCLLNYTRLGTGELKVLVKQGYEGPF